MYHFPGLALYILFSVASQSLRLFQLTGLFNTCQTNHLTLINYMTDIYKNCVDFLQVKNADVTVETVELHSVEEFYPNYVILP